MTVREILEDILCLSCYYVTECNKKDYWCPAFRMLEDIYNHVRDLLQKYYEATL